MRAPQERAKLVHDCRLLYPTLAPTLQVTVNRDFQELLVLDPKLFDDLSRRVAEGMPRSLQMLQGDLERNLRSALEAALRQLDLVSREEFEIQRAVLERTREKLDALEARIAELEKGA